jgi:Skp family chaperone for outer membrane proteins
MTQSETPTWSGALQRELEGIRRNTENRFTDFSNRLDKLLTKLEYDADKRYLDTKFDNINEKLQDSEEDVEVIKRELRDSLESLRRDLLAERQRYETAINQEARTRQTEHTGYIAARQEQFRWLVSLVMIPIAIAVVDLLVRK